MVKKFFDNIDKSIIGFAYVHNSQVVKGFFREKELNNFENKSNIRR